MTIDRRKLLTTTAAVAVASPFVLRVTRANAAEFTLKYANNSPVTHPLVIRAGEALEKIKKETDGKVEIQMFPNNQLGSDTDMLSQLRSGGDRVLHAVGPDPVDAGAGRLDQRHRLRLVGLRQGLDGDGRRARRLSSAREIAKAGLVAMDKIWDNGFRQITSIDQADQGAGRPQGLQDPRPAVAAVDVDVQGVRGVARLHQFLRDLLGAADQGGRGPGKSARHHQRGEAVRGAEVSAR